jgi:hypothetical protein
MVSSAGTDTLYVYEDADSQNMQPHAAAYCAWIPKQRTLFAASYRPLPALHFKVRAYAMYGVHVQSCRPSYRNLNLLHGAHSSPGSRDISFINLPDAGCTHGLLEAYSACTLYTISMLHASSVVQLSRIPYVLRVANTVSTSTDSTSYRSRKAKKVHFR